jgi:hypothetical protein
MQVPCHASVVVLTAALFLSGKSPNKVMYAFCCLMALAIIGLMDVR